MNNYLKEIKAILILVLIGGITFGLIELLNHAIIRRYFFYAFFIYISLFVSLVLIKTVVTSKILDETFRIAIIPFYFVYALVTILLPFVYILMQIFLYYAISLIFPILFSKSIKYFNLGLIINPTTLTYLQWTATVFIAVLFNFQIRTIINKLTFMPIKSSNHLKPYNLEKLTDSLLSENNVRFIIYGLYVILLVAINFRSFENVSILNDKAILQSFVTFIAFDRLLTLLKQLDFKPSDFLIQIAKSIVNQFRSHEKKQS